jgi:ribosomal protein L24
MEEEDYSEKPNLRSKGSRLGIKTNNTIKYDRYQDSLQRSSLNSVGVYEVNNPQGHINFRYYRNQPLSINKDKRWEKIEELKKDPNFVVVENIDHKKAKTKSWTDTYKEDESSEEEEEEISITKGRKGKQIKQKRTPGKKGVKKHEYVKPTLEAEFIVEVSKAPTKNDGLMFHSEDSGYYSPDWSLGIEKNNQKKKRKRVKDQCNL